MRCSRKRLLNGFASQKLKRRKSCNCSSGAGFVTSRRGTKGGFHLAAEADRITMGKVIDFFLSRHPPEPDDDLAVMRVFEKTSAPCQKAFGRLTLVDVASIRQTKRSEIARRGSARSGRKTGYTARSKSRL